MGLAPGERRGSEVAGRCCSGCSTCPACGVSGGTAGVAVPGVRAVRKPRLACPGVSPAVPGIRRGRRRGSSGAGRLSSDMRRTPKLQFRRLAQVISAAQDGPAYNRNHPFSRNKRVLDEPARLADAAAPATAGWRTRSRSPASG